MILKTVKEEHYQDYKLPSMLIAFPSCSWKCEKECGMRVCQNSALAISPNIDIQEREIVEQYLANPITKAIVMAGLEPFDSYSDMLNLIISFRSFGVFDPIIIYTGYREDEINHQLQELVLHGDIIVKFGRYVPNEEPHYDEILGVLLASNNQYAKKLERL